MLPSPVFITPREMKKAHSTSQTSGSLYPLSASAGVIVPVTAMAQTPKSTTAPAGAGRIEPTMVAMKMASSHHDLSLMPSGAPAAFLAGAIATTTSQRHHTRGGPSVGGVVRTPAPSAGSSEAAAELASAPASGGVALM
jgi:hypothetical protein